MPPVVAAVVVALHAVGVVSTAAALSFLGSVWFSVTSWALMIGGSVGYSRAQQRKMKRSMAAQSASMGERRMNVRVAADTGKLILGEVPVGGTVFFVEQTGTNKEYTHLAIAHACHECDSFQKHYLNDEEVTLDGSGVVNSGKFSGLITIKNYLGTDGQTVSTDLQTAVTSSVWTNDHRVRGWCWTYMKAKTDYDVFQGGLPTYSAMIRGAKPYDPRTATTSWTNNWALLVRWYLALSRTRGGVGATSDELPDAYFNAAANASDETVNLNGGGTEKRYTINGVIDTAVVPGENLAALIAAGAGIMPYVNGQFCLRAGAHSSALMDLDEDDIVGPIELQTRDSARESFNGVKGLYVSEKNNWQPADFPPVVNATYTTEDGGERIWEDVILNFTTSSATAQRLAKIMLERSRQDFMFTAAFKLKALNLIPGDVVTLTLARYGFSAKEFEVVQTALRLEQEGEISVLKCYLTLRETASGVWDWSSGEETTIDLAPNTTLVSRYTVPTPASFSAAVATASERTALPRIRLTWTAPADALVTSGGYTEVEYKKASESDWTPWSRIPGAATFDFVSDLEIGTSYNFRIRHTNRHGIRSAYSSTATVTATSGKGTYTALLTNEAHAVSCDSGGSPIAGELGSGGRAFSDVLAFAGASTLSAVASSPGVGQFSISVATHSGTATFTKVDNDTIRCDSITTDSAVARVTIDLEGVLSVTKDFSVTKVTAGTDGNDGTDGDDAEVLYVQSDAAAVNRSDLGVYTPASIEISAFSKIGTAAPTAYSGRFIIATLASGVWTNQYTSAGNESAKSYTVPSSISAIRVRLYLAGGTSTLVDEQIVPIVLDGNPGTDGTDGVSGNDGIFREFVWRRSATQPATPTGNGIPSGWSDDPPNGSDPLWMSVAKQELDGTLVSGESWSTPIRHDGPTGDLAPNGSFEMGDVYWQKDLWSITSTAGLNSTWGASHPGGTISALRNAKLVPCKTGDRFRLTGNVYGADTTIRLTWFDSAEAELSSTNSANGGAGAWSTVTVTGSAPASAYFVRAEAVCSGAGGKVDNIVLMPAGADGTNGNDGIDGEDGIFREFVWQRAATIPSTPTGNGIPSGWYDDPPAGSNPLWMSVAKQELDGTLISGESWSTPIRHDGPEGPQGPAGAAATIARASGGDNAGLNSGGQTTIASVSKTAATVLVSGNVTVENQDAVADSGVTVRVYRDSTLIHTLPNFNMAAYEIDGPVAFSVTDNPGAGTYTYAVKAYRTVSGATIYVTADFAVI